MSLLIEVLLALAACMLAAAVVRRMWVHWKLGRRRLLVDEAGALLAESLVSGRDPALPEGRVQRRAFRLAALELLGTIEGEGRARLTELLERLGLVGDVERTLARSPREFARRTAADELAEMRSSSASETLARGLADSDAMVRLACVRGLAALRADGEVERLIRVLDADADRAPSASMSSMVALAVTEPDALVRLELTGESAFARRLAALALARTGNQGTMPLLLAELASENALLTFVAIRAIEHVGGPIAEDALAKVAGDSNEDATLRDQAESALERVRGAGSR